MMGMNVKDVGSRVGAEITADKVGDKGIGAIVYLTPSGGGEVSLDALCDALRANGSEALPPNPPSTRDRTARAAASVGKAHGYSVVSRRRVQGAKRGTNGWELVRGSHVDANGSGILGDRVSPIVATARDGHFEGDALVVDELLAAYIAGKDALTSDDLSSWFTAKVAGLGGIGIKAGVYYLPPESAASFHRMVNAIQQASSGRYEVHAVAMANTEGSIRSVLSALVTDTETSIQEINEQITKGCGAKALATREETCRALLARLTRYAALLGPRLDAIQTSVEAAQSAVAVAMLAATRDEDEASN